MAKARRKKVTMTVTVSCPAWMSAQQARREVRTLINFQAFYGHDRYDPKIDEYLTVDESNFRAVSVRAEHPENLKAWARDAAELIANMRDRMARMSAAASAHRRNEKSARD